MGQLHSVLMFTVEIHKLIYIQHIIDIYIWSALFTWCNMKFTSVKFILTSFDFVPASIDRWPGLTHSWHPIATNICTWSLETGQQLQVSLTVTKMMPVIIFGVSGPYLYFKVPIFSVLATFTPKMSIRSAMQTSALHVYNNELAWSFCDQ